MFFHRSRRKPLLKVKDLCIRLISASAVPDSHVKPLTYTGPSLDEVVTTRKKYVNPAIFAYYKEPLMLVEGKGQYVFDENGMRYLDNFGGIVTISVGHCHPEIVKAGQEQMAKLMHSTTIYYNPEMAMFAKELVARMPEGSGLDTVYFTNSGSEANDLAVLMARAHTGCFDVVSLRNGYHGMSEFTRGLTALNTWRHPVPHAFGVHHARCPNQYRGPHGYDDKDAGRKYASDVQDLILHATPGQIACFIAESIQGVGGTITFPDGYLKQVYSYVRNVGGLCIADEVQTGFGRLGTDYWGFQQHNVVPDIVTMAKGIGNGVPLAAVVARKEVATAFAQRIHFNT
eukprot:984767_1